MSEHNPRKRHRLEHSLHADSASQTSSKRQKRSVWCPVTAFWDSLSNIALTREALRELNRRHNQITSSRPPTRHRHLHRRVPRSSERRRNRSAPHSAVDYLRHCEPATLKDIQAFARRGGPDLSGLRGCFKPFDPLRRTISSGHSSFQARKRGSPSSQSTWPMAETPATKSETRPGGVYDRNFQQTLIDGGTYPHAYEYPNGRIPGKPENWQEINLIMAQDRASLSSSKFSDSAHAKLARADAHAAKEKQVSEFVLPLIAGEVRDTRCVAGGIPFGNLEPLIKGRPDPDYPDLPEATLEPGNPDLYYGARPEQLNRRVRTELSGSIVPSTQDDLPIAPNFFLTTKGIDGSLGVAGRQACYDGALGARGMHHLRSYGQSNPAYDNNAYTVTSTYHGGTLKMYTSHPVEGTGPHAGKSEYYMHQVKGYVMTSDPDTFRQGATAFRNLRDWAEEQRNTAIAHANDRANDAVRTQSRVPAVTTTSFTAEVSSLVTATSLGGDSESLSQVSIITPNELSHPDESALQGPETSTSMDEVAASAPAKRSSSDQHSSRRRKRNTGESSGRAGSACGFIIPKKTAVVS